MNKKLYEALKWVVLVLVPALVFLIVGLNGIWDIPDQDRIVATITLVGAFLGLLLQLKTPYDGTAYITPGVDLDEPDKFNLHLKDSFDPADLENHKVVRLRVKKQAA